MAVDTEILLPKSESLAPGNTDLPFHEIKAGNKFRYRVLHLKTGIHFEKIKVPVSIYQKLYSACTDIITGLGHPHGSLPHSTAHFRGYYGTRRFLHDFLVPALHRAFAFK